MKYKTSQIVKVIYLITLTYFIGIKSIYSQDDYATRIRKYDSASVANALIYLKEKLGDKFINKYLEFKRIEQSAFVVYYLRKSECPEKNMLVILTRNTVVDTSFSSLTKAPIICSKENCGKCSLYLNREAAIAIAKKRKFNEGTTPWRVYLSLIDGLSWIIENRLSPVSVPRYSSEHGEVLQINAKTGKIPDELMQWDSQE